MPKPNPPFPKVPLTRTYVFYMDDAPLFGFESQDDEDAALKTLNEGIELPRSHRYELREVTAVSTEDLQRLKLMMELKSAMFAMAQIAEAVRAGKSGLLLARPGQVPPS